MTFKWTLTYDRRENLTKPAGAPATMQLRQFCSGSEKSPAGGPRRPRKIIRDNNARSSAHPSSPERETVRGNSSNVRSCGAREICLVNTVCANCNVFRASSSLARIWCGGSIAKRYTIKTPRQTLLTFLYKFRQPAIANIIFADHPPANIAPRNFDKKSSRAHPP